MQQSPVPSLTGTDITAWVSNLSPRRVGVHFHSPLHLRHSKPPRKPLKEREFEFHHLWDGLQSRLEDLMSYHCGIAYQSEFTRLKKQSQRVVKVEDSLSWQSQWRLTSTGQTVDMGGLMGHAVFEGELTPFLDVLAAGEWLHLGHGCDLGNGRYSLLMDDPHR